MKKSITIHDIAKLANVSSATVSRVLSNSQYPVSSELRLRIQRLAKEQNYIPNLLGKQLKTNNNTTIGVIIPSISNPFYSSVMLGIEEIARKNNYHVLLCNSLQDPELEVEYLKTIFEKQIRGLIISSISSDKKSLKNLIEMGLNVVAIDQKFDLDNVFQIQFDYRRGGYLATKYLIEKGHQRIAYVTAPLDRPSRKSIFQGYLDAVSESGIDIKKSWIQEAKEAEKAYEGIYEFDNGKLLARKLLSIPEIPTAIFACNDMTAFGVMNELSAQGIQVPREISVMGFDNIEFGQMVTPSLTTIKQPNYDMGKLACKMLLEILSGEQEMDIDIMLKPQIVERNSIASITF